MQSRCACAVVDGASASSALEELHVCTAQIHGMGVSIGWSAPPRNHVHPHKEAFANDWRSWLDAASAHHSRNMFAKKIFQFVVAGAVVMSAWSLMYP